MSFFRSRFFKFPRPCLQFASLVLCCLAGNYTVFASLPLGWSDADIGAPALAGSASATNGNWTVTGGGADIWNAADQFNFASSSDGSDGSITVQVTSLQNSDPGSGWARAGIMFRNDSTAGAVNVSLMVSATQGLSFQSRNASGGQTSQSIVGGISAPVWLQLVRSGVNFTANYSTDGSNWMQAGTQQIYMNGSVQAGLAVTAHNNAALNTATFTNVSLSSQAFGVYRQLWMNLTANLGNTLTALTNTAYNPNWPNNPSAAYTHIFTSFDTEVNSGWNNYGQRLRAFVVPPTNGYYTFWIASDDASLFLFSTNENPAAASPVASVINWTSWHEFTKEPNQQSAPIYLQAGLRYYMEALMQQGGGGDDLTVQWQLPSGTIELPMTTPSAAGTLLIPYTGTTSAPGIYWPPTNTTGLENGSVTFSVLVTNQASVSYRWLLNTTNLPGANTPIVTLTNLTLGLSGQLFSCIVSNASGSVTSAPAMLTVAPDTTLPVVVRGFNVGLTNVTVVYSKRVEAASATDAGNYGFTNGLAVTGAVLGADTMSVVLTTGPLVYGSNYGLVINNVRDRAALPNTIATNTLVTFPALPYAPQDLGAPATPATVAVAGNGLNVTAAGGDFGGNADQGNFSYQVCTGNFDVRVRLAGLGLSDIFSKAGLMARENLTASSRFAAALATPAMNGSCFEWRDPTGNASSAAGRFPANYPNTWLRLQRVGSTFTGYGSYDGQTWTLLGSATIAMPSQLYFGLAVSSRSASAVTTAQFRDIFNVTNALVGVVANPHDALGPTSRKTPLVFSEIMYKPAARTDGRNLEFLELYNSNPWFQDLGGYQITCADMRYTFPAGTRLSGGGYLVVAAVPADIQSIYGITNVMGPYTGSLKKAETLELLDEQGAVLLTLPYSNVYPWPVATEGTGHSLVLANPTYGEGDPRAWDLSDTVGGSPGQQDAFTPSPLRNVVINEFLPHSENPAVPQFIELYNHATNSVDVSGGILTDDPATNKFVIPAGTVIGPAGFVAFTNGQFNFTLNGAGGTLYFIKPDQSRILDAVPFGAQADGISYGRWPDGANDFYACTTNTPGTNNSTILIGDIVLNELMYDPISGNDDDQYIELYNQGTNTVNLAGWQLSAAVTFTFPSVTIAPGGFLVVGRNPLNLFAKYPNLNPGNTVGDFSGKLSHNGELLVLSRPQTLNTNTPIQVAEDQVTYGAGGRWGEWSAGGGSSLELKDTRANHRLAANWADSDETQKSVWTNIETTAVLDNGANYDATIDYAQIGLLDVGECLVDNLEVDYNGSNYVSNSTLEGGTSGWTFQGCHTRSSLENTGYLSSHSLHIRCSDRVWTGVNSCELALKPNALAAGQTVTLRYKARWLHGWPEPLLRLNGNWLEATAAMPVPANLGTPGLPNSQQVSHAGPAIYHVTHNPPVPAAGQPVVVTAQLHDPNGVQIVRLYYRLDPATTYNAVLLRDNGLGGDAIAGDGIYSATIPGQAANQIVAFYISATDALGAVTRFPALRPGDNEPVREGVVMFGDGNPGGSFPVYHLWLTQTNITRWGNLSDLSNEANDGTLVCGNRVIYNMQGRFAGSPYHQGFDYPNGNLCHYKWIFGDDDKFLGATSFNKIHQPGNGAGDDASLQREQIANSLLRALGVPWLYRHYVAVYVNGSRRGALMEDAQTPDGDVVKEHFPNDAGGWLYKMQPWFEFGPAPSGSSIPFNNNSWCSLSAFTTTGGVKKPARYRYNWEIRRTPDSANDFSPVFALVDAANAFGSPNFVANLENVADMENWMRVFAANHAAGNWDSFGAPNGQNLYGYTGTLGTKYSLLMFDFNISIGNSGSWGPGQNLLAYDSGNQGLVNIYNTPAFLRMYWRALGELVNGPLNTANSGPLIEAKYNAFAANGLSVENPVANIEPWLAQAGSSIAAQLAAVNAASFAVNPGVSVSNNLAYVTGTAPVNVATVWLNGAAYPVTWTSLTTWAVSVPLQTGTNRLTLAGVDRHGQPLAGATNSVSVVYNATNNSPLGQIVLNEIMYAPLAGNAQFVELYNNSPTTAFDLSGWQLNGLAYTFPAGAVLAPTNYLVLAANGPAYATAYGATNPVFDTFSGTLSANGETLTLNTASNLPVAKVKYSNALPWATNANGSGASLQLVDPRQDNWRAGNWSAAAATPAKRNSVAAALTPFPSLWLNEVQADNLTGITNRAGQHAPWLELYNPGTNSLSLNGLYLANNYTNLLQWPFPANASLNPGQFKVIFADGLTNLATTNELHTGFGLPSRTGSLALTRLATNGLPQVLDYLDYQNINLNDSYGSFPDGQSFLRQEFFQATPGAANNGTATPPASFIAYSQPGLVYTQNFDALPNPGALSVNADNPVTNNGVIYSLANPYDFAFPATATGSSGGLGLGALAGWYGAAAASAKFGMTDGDQTTGGQLSFGLPNSANRALGLLATSSTKATAFGARLINSTAITLTRINVQFTGEVWRQSNLPKTLQCYYFIDPTGTNTFPTNTTSLITALNVTFPTVPADTGGVAVDGTAPLNQTNLGVFNQTITNWPPGAALWLVWQMTDATGKAQGLAIDNLSFSANVPLPVPLAIQTAGTNLLLNWPGTTGQSYQLEYKDDLTAPAWTPLGNPRTGTGTTLTTTNIFSPAAQRYFRLRLVN